MTVLLSKALKCDKRRQAFVYLVHSSGAALQDRKIQAIDCELIDTDDEMSMAELKSKGKEKTRLGENKGHI